MFTLVLDNNCQGDQYINPLDMISGALTRNRYHSEDKL